MDATLFNGSTGAVKDVVICVIGAVISVYIPMYFSKKDKRDQKKDDEMWARINHHAHTIKCDNKECKPETGQVIITEK